VFEIVMVRQGELVGGPDQVVRDVVLIASGLILVVAGLLMRREARSA
jgi:hypothetical protein